MVGGLVEQQHVGGLPGQPGEDDAATLPVGQLLDGGRLERGQIVMWELGSDGYNLHSKIVKLNAKIAHCSVGKLSYLAYILS